MVSIALDGEGNGVAAAEAEGGDAALQVAALHFVEQRDQNARAGAPIGMTDGYRASVDVHFFGIELQFAGDRDGGDGKCLVQLDRDRRPCRDPSRSSSAASRRHRLAPSLPISGSTPLTACATMRAMGVFAEALCVAFTGDHQRGGAIIGARSVAGSYRAVFLERRLELARALRETCLRAAIRHI